MSNVPRLITVDRLHCILEPHAWDFATLRAEDIQSHWREKTRANPSLYDGRVLLARRVAQSGDAEGDRTLSIEFFETGFSNFLAWRDFGFPDTGFTIVSPWRRCGPRTELICWAKWAPATRTRGPFIFPGERPIFSICAETLSILKEARRANWRRKPGLSLQGAELEPSWTIVFDRHYVACLKTISSPELGRGSARPRASSSDAGGRSRARGHSYGFEARRSLASKGEGLCPGVSGAAFARVSPRPLGISAN